MSTTRFPRFGDGSVTATGTARRTLGSGPAGVVYLRARSTNTGTVTVGSPTGTGGIRLAAGEFHPPIGTCADLAQIGVQFSAVGDVLEFTYTG